MLEIAIPRRATLERTVERLRRAARTMKVRGDRALRQELAHALPPRPELDHLVDERLGYGRLPAGLIEAVPEAVRFAQEIRDERKAQPAKKKADYNPTILEAKRYDDAPAFFDLALSDDILKIASDYLGEIPVLVSMKLWCTPVNDHLKGSQLYHRDGHKWLLRRAKFLINMVDVDEDCGPFTFLPADVSERVSESIGTMTEQGRVTDDRVYRNARPQDAISLIGPAGTGMIVDSSRCFHHGARVKKGERLLLQFNFLSIADAVHGGPMQRTAAFDARFGGDRVRELTIPNHA